MRRLMTRNLVSQAGLVPAMALARRARPAALVDEHVRIGHRCEVNAGLKVPGLAAGMIAGADSIDDMDLLAARRDAGAVRRGPGPRPRWARSCGPSSRGNALQLEKASRVLPADLARRAPLLPGRDTVALATSTPCKARLRTPAARRGVRPCQDPGKSLLVRGLNTLAATISTQLAAP